MTGRLRKTYVMLKCRSRIFDILIAAWALVLSPVIPLLMLLRQPDLNRRMIRFWARGAFVLSRMILGLNMREIGTVNRPRSGPCLYVANHQSAWETLAFNLLIPDVCIVAKIELARIPIFGWFLRHAPMILVDRAAGAKAVGKMLKEAREAVAEGRSILIFPEGTRVRPGRHRRFQPGVAALYRSFGEPVVPLAHNSGMFWTSEGKKPGCITVSYLARLPAGLPPQDAMALMEEAVNGEKDRLAGGSAD